MTKDQMREITRISKEFASGFEWDIAESGILIVDPLMALLEYAGYDFESKITDSGVLFMLFDTAAFFPAGSLIDKPGAHDWMWIDASGIVDLKAKYYRASNEPRLRIC